MSEVNSENLIEKRINELCNEINKLNKLFEITKILNYEIEIYSLAEKLVVLLKNLFETENAAMFVLEGSKYRIYAYNNIESPFTMEFQKAGESIWDTLETGKPFIVNKNGENLYSNFFEYYELSELNSYIWLPFVHDSEVLAVISLGNKKNGSYTDEDIKFLERISEYIAPSLHKFFIQKNKDMSITELQKTLHNISILYNVGQAMNFIDDLKNLLKVILSKAIKTIGAEKGSLMLYDGSQNELVVKVVYGIADKEVEEKINEGLIECTKIKAGEGIAGTVFATKKAIITNLGSDDPRFIQAEISNVSSILCVPLVVKGEAIGVINITNKLNDKYFNQDDLDFMGALSNQAAIAINNAQLYELATRDGLTKLYIHRHFYYLLENEIKRSDRYNHPISLMIMDIDNFKVINDTYGHQIGDEILKHIANAITSTCRKIDMPARYGGEEFALILPETIIENTRKIAERLRQKIENIVVVNKDNISISPTISIGISAYPLLSKNLENFIETADKALYHAKNSGKNCVAEYSSDECVVLSCSSGIRIQE